MNIEEAEKTYGDVNDFARAYFDEVPRIAGLVYKDRGVLDPDDIAQEIWTVVVSDFEASFSGVEYEEVLKRFRVIGKRAVAREAISLQHFSGSFVYSPEAVRLVLEAGGLPGDDEFGKVDSVLDVTAAYEGLAPAMKRAITKRYTLGIPHGELSRAEQEACRRGVVSMTHFLNRGTEARSIRLDAPGAPEL